MDKYNTYTEDRQEPKSANYHTVLTYTPNTLEDWSGPRLNDYNLLEAIRVLNEMVMHSRDASVRRVAREKLILYINAL